MKLKTMSLGLCLVLATLPPRAALAQEEGRASSDEAPQGEDAAHVMGKVGGGDRRQGGRKGQAGGRGADGGSTEDAGPQGKAHGEVMGKVDRKQGRPARGNQAGGRGGDGGSTDDAGPQGEDAAHVMGKVGGEGKRRGRGGNTGGRGGDGGALEDGELPSVAGVRVQTGDGINQSRANKRGQAGGWLDDPKTEITKFLNGEGQTGPAKDKGGGKAGGEPLPKTQGDIEAQKEFLRKHPEWGQPPKSQQQEIEQAGREAAEQVNQGTDE